MRITMYEHVVLKIYSNINSTRTSVIDLSTHPECQLCIDIKQLTRHARELLSNLKIKNGKLKQY